MLFSTDKQTINDLGIFGRPGTGSIYGLFNQTSTRIGATILEEMFQYPLSGMEQISRRSNIFKYFAVKRVKFPFRPAVFDTAEQWLADTDERTILGPEDKSHGKKLMTLVARDTKFNSIQDGVMAIIEIAHAAQSFINSLGADVDVAFQQETKEIMGLLSEAPFENLLLQRPDHKPGYQATSDYDVMLRFRHHEKTKKLLRYCYHLDVYITVARVANDIGFSFPKVLPSTENVLKLEGVYHPLVPNAVSNNFGMTVDNNMVFLTGANMAGKSTFMKTVGLAVFLAHMGFPVPAKQMEFSVLDGIYTSINLPDNLGMGVSHFYAEVLRVKKVAKELQLAKKLFVMFDELFRGTNVKDAYEATIAIVDAFAQNRNSQFIVSTHIIEAGEVLRERFSNISFLYLPTKMDGLTPVYTYQIAQGITSDRHGMVIINNEGILDILNGTLQIA
ncbi:MAG: DNA mismatch repair protein [Bacteroidota bacterium]